jgi:hypothetical protein
VVQSLQALLAPRSIAILGASSDPGKLKGRALEAEPVRAARGRGRLTDGARPLGIAIFLN